MTEKIQTFLDGLKKEIESLRKEIFDVCVTSPDTAYRLRCTKEAYERAVEAIETGKVYIGGGGRALSTLIFGANTIPEDNLIDFCKALLREKACGGALLKLNGLKGLVKRGKRCWIIDLSKKKDFLASFYREGGMGYSICPCAPMTNGHGHWAFVLWSSMPTAVELGFRPDGPLAKYQEKAFEMFREKMNTKS